MIPCAYSNCQTCLASLSDLLIHLKSVHHVTSLDSVECQLCPRVFTNLRSFKQHFLVSHKRHVLKRNSNSTEVQLGDANDTEEPATENSLNTHTGSIDLDINAETSNVVSSSSMDRVLNVIPVGTSVKHKIKRVVSDENIKEALEAKVFSFCSEIYSLPSIPLSHAEKTVQSTLDLVRVINNGYKENMVNLSVNRSNENLKHIIPNMNEIFTFVEGTFGPFKTKHLSIKTLKEKGLYFPPIRITLGLKDVRRKFKKRFCVVSTKQTSAFIPLRRVLCKFLEQKDVLPNVLQFLEKLKSDDVIIENVVQGQNWRKFISSNTDKVILPLFLDNDDIEVGNALMGHGGVNKINATYVSIPCLLPEVRASLSHIFLAQLTKSSNLKCYGNRKIFKRIIHELKFLSKKGITVKLDGKPVQVFFQLCALIGDNLGLNSIAGFAQNFSTSQYCCRICLADRDRRKIQTIEVENLLRTVQNYERDVNKEHFQETGIHERCVFNDVSAYHIISNGGVDVTHDLFEGVVQYDICFMMNYYIYTSKNFTLAEANDRISKFNYGSADISSKPPQLPENLKKRKTLKMSASECACLLKYFGLLFANLGNPIPVNDPVWQLYIALRKIVDIVMSPYVDLKVCTLLAAYISEHHILYRRLTKRPLTFKFHSLIHYPRLMCKFGPLVLLATIRFEHKHRVLKSVSNAVASRRDICYTMARKCQLQMSYSWLSNKFSGRTLLTGPEAFSPNDRFFAEIADYIFTTPIPEVLKDECTIRAPWIEYKGTRYCEDETLYVELDELTDLPIFGLIKNIFVSNQGVVYFFLRNFRTVSFNEHLYCYEVELANSYSVVSHEAIYDFRPQNAVFVLGSNFFVSLLYDM